MPGPRAGHPSSFSCMDARVKPGHDERGSAYASARIELGIPVEKVAPAMVQIIGRESPPIFLQLECRGLRRFTSGKHPRLLRQAIALEQIAALAGGNHVAPGRAPAARARHDMVEGQLMGWAAARTILTGEAVAQEHVESG